MENWWWAVIVVVLLILGSVGIYNMINSKKLKNANIKSYNLIKCLSECSNIKGKNNVFIIDDNCKSICNSYYGDIPVELRRNQRLILNSEENIYCDKVYEENGAKEYKNCLINMLPLIKEQYDYLKELS